MLWVREYNVAMAMVESDRGDGRLAINYSYSTDAHNNLQCHACTAATPFEPVHGLRNELSEETGHSGQGAHITNFNYVEY